MQNLNMPDSDKGIDIGLLLIMVQHSIVFKNIKGHTLRENMNGYLKNLVMHDL